MAKGNKSKKVLILDDEPEYLEWVKEFLESRGLSVEFVRTLPEALQALGKREYRLILVDMNVPGVETVAPRVLKEFPTATKFPGIALAVMARSLGYGAHSVIAYTVHDDEAAGKELGKLHCRYVLKGRAQIFKSVVDASLNPAPMPPKSAHKK